MPTRTTRALIRAMPVLLLAGGLLAASAAQAQSCSSDGQPAPAMLVERFLNADCEACWADKSSGNPAEHTLVLDWITPGSRGEDAPLSTAALRDSLWRLQALGQAVPANASQWRQAVAALPGLQLRVAHGAVLNGYVGASIALALPPGLAKTAAQQGWSAWLAVVEAIPAGTEGTPVARQLVRNTHQPRWNWDEATEGGSAPLSFSDSRIMSLPGGTRAERLGVVGWVQDGQGRVLAAVRSRCMQAD